MLLVVDDSPRGKAFNQQPPTTHSGQPKPCCSWWTTVQEATLARGNFSRSAIHLITKLQLPPPSREGDSADSMPKDLRMLHKRSSALLSSSQIK
ncbi:hypothetical protein PanWU01x14_311240 [Parasponia andersonii]|uniref:Uncharacterized protein n=1 Tax=Parasponia andersonii TaxID=3476 RepID=A0A2P5APY0_PARAD|nr:hypothetical protein PanWU01x14_311240 [Parasponia andersonii]